MAITRQLAHLNFDLNQLLNVVVHVAATPPTPTITGQIFYSTASGGLFVQHGTSGWLPATAELRLPRWHQLLGGVNTSGNFVVSGSVATISGIGNAVVSANQFNNNAVIPVLYGGVGVTGFDIGAVPIGSGSTNLINRPSFFFYDITNNFLSVGPGGNWNTTSANNRASLNIAADITGHHVSFVPKALNPLPSSHTLEYDGSGVYVTPTGTTRYTMVIENSGLLVSGYIPFSLGTRPGAVHFKQMAFSDLPANPYVTTTGTVTLDANQRFVFCNTVSGNISQILPLASGIGGRLYTFKKLSASNLYTLACAGADVVDGSTTMVLTALNQYVSIVSNNISGWHIVGSG